jgi:NAD-reducing hydrogenase small subunit
MSKVRIATVWLDGCSGCHMSVLDMDERLVELSEKIDVVFSPLVDHKEFPEQVDVTLVEGAVATDEDEKKIKMVRSRTKILVSLGDCAVTGNVPSMRNPFKLEDITRRAYSDTVDLQAQVPTQMVPRLLPRVSPVHEVVKVDVCLPGCPPSADTIYYILTEMLEGRPADVSTRSRFGA